MLAIDFTGTVDRTFGNKHIDLSGTNRRSFGNSLFVVTRGIKLLLLAFRELNLLNYIINLLTLQIFYLA